MAGPQLRVPIQDFDREWQKLYGLTRQVGILPAAYQKISAEIVVLRLFDLLQALFHEVAIRLACGSTYLDGTAPILLNLSKTTANAEKAMLTLGRTKPLTFLKWSKASYANGNVGFVLDPADHFRTFLTAHTGDIEELRRIRNRIAHRNTQTRSAYRDIVRRHYGATPNSITPGVLLLSRRNNPTLLEGYLRKTQVFAKNLVKL